VHLFELQVVIRMDGQLPLLPLHLAMRSFEVVSLLDFALHILQRVVDFGEVGFGNDIEGRHGNIRSGIVGRTF